MHLKIVMVLLAGLSLVLLSGCNTAQGFGKDIENLGRVIQGKKTQPTNVANTETIVVDEVVEQPAGYIVEEPYAREVIDLSQPVENGASQSAPAYEETGQPAAATQKKKTAF